MTITGCKRGVSKAVALGLHPLMRFRRREVVIAFHRIDGGTRWEIDYPARSFAPLLDWLVARYSVVPLGWLVRREGEGWGADPGEGRGSGPSALPRAALTFDDAYADFSRLVLPALRERALPATVFVPTGFIDGELASPLTSAGDHPPDWAPCSWAALREAGESGLVEIGCHSRMHRDVTTLDRHTLAADLDYSVERIEAETGVRPASFAYPRGRWSAQAERVVSERFSCAVLASGGPIPAGCSPYRIPRVPVLASDRMFWARQRIEGRLALDDMLRLRSASGLVRRALTAERIGE